MQKFGLNQTLTQTTKLSPTQIQVIRMLELPSIELSKRINEELQENPALEEGRLEENETENYTDEYGEYGDEFGNEFDGDHSSNPLQNEDFNYEQYVSDDETPSYMLNSHNNPIDQDRREVPIIGGSSLIEELKSQIYLTKMDKHQRHIAKWVLGNIDDDGYLRRTTEQLVDDLMFQEQLQITDEEMDSIVQQIKQFDPPGIASADLRECLLTQLKRKQQTESVQLAYTILNQYFEAFSKHHYDKITQRIGCTNEAFQGAVQEIIHLNQNPANAFVGSVYETQQETIIPDFTIENRNDELFVTLNTGDIPELHISRDYNDMLASYSAMPQKADIKQATQFIRSKIESARGFIDAIRQRNETLITTMSAILKFQYEFFLDGEETSLKPMVLQDIADRTGYDVSTISRVSNSKWVDTPYGIYPLKYFFSESITNDEGDEVSTREVKKILQELVAAEDKTNPLNDGQLEEALRQKGYIVARRTVAKYRDMLNIPVARLRKTL
ncbi:MAG: RNA polymerase factor sigma-54 [Paludibacteraceae bacterium]|nr:RNA polymerase factor sigma-54 [Paludibacteraceae bacterium]